MRAIQCLLAVPLVLAAAAACGDVGPTRRDEFFNTESLTGAAERPNPVTTQATGDFLAAARDTATVGGKKDSLAVLRYAVTVVNINAATAAHIHAGGENVAGPVIVSLFSGPTTGNGFTGQIAQGEISRSSTFNPPFNFDSLLIRMRNGTAYVNVHTTANPGGEIRGQIQ